MPKDKDWTDECAEAIANFIDDRKGLGWLHLDDELVAEINSTVAEIIRFHKTRRDVQENDE